MAQPVVAPRPMKILVVEDDALIAMMLDLALADAGHTVLGPVSTAKQGLAVAELAPPDLALVNINLADGHGSGIELARQLHQRWGIWSFFVSGQRDAAYGARDVALGYIGKPYTPETVLQAVEIARAIALGDIAAPAMSSARLELFHTLLPITRGLPISGSGVARKPAGL